jgi:hypothetical protein
MSSPVSRVISGRYRLGRQLGEGGMGAVYEAVHVTTQRRCAIKLLHPHHARDPAMTARFVREAQASAQIGHPGLVEILDAGREEDGSLFLAMELLDGESLGARLARLAGDTNGRLFWIAKLLEPLEAAHAKGFVHRDLKPENAFIARRADGSEILKLLDFGLARQMDGPTVTATHERIGTVAYMSPEQWRSLREATPASDVWAIGVMIYQCIADVPPFTGATFAELMIEVCTREHAPLRQWGAPPALAELVDACLAKDPARRVPGARELRRRLAPLIDERRATPVARTIPLAQVVPTHAVDLPPATSTPRRGGWTIAAAALGAVALVALGSAAYALWPASAEVDSGPPALRASWLGDDPYAQLQRLRIESAPGARITVGETTRTAAQDGSLVVTLDPAQIGFDDHVEVLSVKDGARATLRVPVLRSEALVDRVELRAVEHDTGAVIVRGALTGGRAMEPQMERGLLRLELTMPRFTRIEIGSARGEAEAAERITVELDLLEIAHDVPVAALENRYAGLEALPEVRARVTVVLERRGAREESELSFHLRPRSLRGELALALERVQRAPLGLPPRSAPGHLLALPGTQQGYLGAPGPLREVDRIALREDLGRRESACDVRYRVYDARSAHVLGERTFEGVSCYAHTVLREAMPWLGSFAE